MRTEAVLELVLLGLAAGPLGVWVLLFRASYAAESLAHGMVPGLVAAAALGVPLVFGALAGAGVTALLAARAGGDGRIGSDTGIAIVTTALFGLGGLLASGDPHDLEPLLFGDLDAITTTDVALAAALALATPLVLTMAHRSLTAGAFAQRAAPVLVLAALGVVVAVAAEAVGALLALALVLGPAAAALVAARRLAVALIAAPVLAALAAVAGLAAAEPLDVLAPAAVALAMVVGVPLAVALVACRNP